MNIASCSWPDHLAFGEGDGRLATPDAVARRLDAWRDGLGAGTVHWRLLRTRIPGHFMAASGHQHPTARAARAIDWNELAVVPRLVHAAGLEAWLYVSVFDEGWPLPPDAERAASHHNAMHGQHVAWQSAFSRAHPELTVVDRPGERRQWGVLALDYPDVRAQFVARWSALLGQGEWDGLFVCLRSQSRPASDGDEFGFDPPVRDAFLARHGRDILHEPFDRPAWRDLRGASLTTLLAEIRAAIGPHIRIGIGAPRGDVIGPPMGNMTLCWRDWIARQLVDALVVNQSSSQCPSMWHQLWPMHRGGGYVQNYLTGDGLMALGAELSREYGPALEGGTTALYVARQWTPRSAADEAGLAAHPSVSGLVFSTFRHDNPAAIARDDWRA